MNNSLCLTVHSRVGTWGVSGGGEGRGFRDPESLRGVVPNQPHCAHTRQGCQNRAARAPQNPLGPLSDRSRLNEMGPDLDVNPRSATDYLWGSGMVPPPLSRFLFAKRNPHTCLTGFIRFLGLLEEVITHLVA